MAILKETIINGNAVINGILTISNNDTSINVGSEIQSIWNTIYTLQGTVQNLDTYTKGLSTIQIRSFSRVFKVTNTSTSIVVFTLSDIKKIFPNATSTTSGAFFMNGDGDACSKHFDGATWKGSSLYCVLNGQANTTAIRVNGLLWYLPN